MRICGIVIVLALTASWPTSADEPTSYYLSARQHLQNVSAALQSVSESLISVRSELELTKQLWRESEADYEARLSDLRRREKQLSEEKSALEAEKGRLERENASLRQDSETSTALRKQLESERRASEAQMRKAWGEGMLVGALASGAVTTLVIMGLRALVMGR